MTEQSHETSRCVGEGDTNSPPAVAAAMSRKERRKTVKKEKRKQRRKEMAEKEREEEEAWLNDPEEQRRIELEEEREKERVERDRREFQEREKLFLQALAIKKAQEEEEEERRRALELEQESNQNKVRHETEVDDDDDWEYIEEGPPEIIWQGNEIIVKRKKVRVRKKDLDQQTKKEAPNRPTSNPLPPQSDGFADYKNASMVSAQQLLENVAQQVPNFGTEQDKAHCPFHLKTGTCRFGSRCSRVHFYPDKACTILIKNMYNGPGLAWEQDEGLEYTDEEVERCYEEFYEDVHTEFLKFGEIVNFKVSCEFVSVTRWKVAICGEYMKSGLKTCSRGTACNFIHCFHNPGGDYEWADWEKPPPRYWVKKMTALFGYSMERESSGQLPNSSKMLTPNTERQHSGRSWSRGVDYLNRSSRNCYDKYDVRRRVDRQRHNSDGRKRLKVIDEQIYEEESGSRNNMLGKSRTHDAVSDLEWPGRDMDGDRKHGGTGKSSRHQIRMLEFRDHYKDRRSRNYETDSDVDLSDRDSDKDRHHGSRSKSSRRWGKVSDDLDNSKSRFHASVDMLDEEKGRGRHRRQSSRRRNKVSVSPDGQPNNSRSRDHDSETSEEWSDGDIYKRKSHTRNHLSRRELPSSTGTSEGVFPDERLKSGENREATNSNRHDHTTQSHNLDSRYGSNMHVDKVAHEGEFSGSKRKYNSDESIDADDTPGEFEGRSKSYDSDETFHERGRWEPENCY